MCIPSALSPPLPPLAPVRPRPSASSGTRSAGQLAAPPHSRGGLYYHAYPLRQGPNPHPSPRSLRSLPPPTPGGGLITFAIPSTKAIPSHVPTLPPLAPVRPRLSASSEARTSGQLAPPRAAPGGVDYIYYTMETIIACPPPITPPTAIDFMLPSSYHLQKPTQAPASADARSRGALIGSRTTAALNAIVNNT